MRKHTELYVFTVEGAGSFPFDMLRYDQCWPYYGADAALLEHHQREKRRVVLQSSNTSLPTMGRWQSFNWRVVGIGCLREAA